MANIDPAAGWPAVRQLEITDKLLAGPGGPLNEQATALVARTKKLLADINAISAGQHSGLIGYATKAEMEADLSPPDRAVAMVTNDPPHLFFRKVGDPDEGSWEEADNPISEVRERLEEMTPPGGNDVAAAVVFSDRSRTYLECDGQGRPTTYAAGLIAEAAGAAIGDRIGVDSSADIQSVAYAVVYPETGDVLFQVFPDGTPAFSGAAPYLAGWPAVAYGDSTTYGDDLTDPARERWSTLLSAAIGRTIHNRGVNGIRANELQARLGAVPVDMIPSGGNIPASGSVTLTTIDTNPVRLGPPIPATIITEGGSVIDGTLSGSGSTAATFTRRTPGGAVSSQRVRVIGRQDANRRGQIMFLGQGINNEPLLASGEHTVSQVKAWYRAATRSITAAKPRVVVWGILDRGVNEAPGTPNGDFIAEIEQWLAEEYGCDYAPVRQFLSSEYAFTVAAGLQPGFSPASADSAAVAVGRTPPSFRATSGSVHLNALGHRLQAWFLHRHLIQRGFV